MRTGDGKKRATSFWIRKFTLNVLKKKYISHINRLKASCLGWISYGVNIFLPKAMRFFWSGKNCIGKVKMGGGRLLSRLYHVRLMRRYGIHITEGTEIGIGLRIAHPSSIIVTKCKIGKNFTIYQNCTIGQKFYGSGQFPVIGDNVTMYAGSNVIGKIKIGDGAVIGAGATVVDDVPDNAIMVGEKGRVKV